MERQQFREQFDLIFDGYIQQKIEYVTDQLSMDVLPIVDYLQDYHQGGKRFRPYMVYLRYKLVGGEQDIYEMMRVGMISELIHLMALVHDDIVDQGETRHHQPCYHRHLQEMYDDTHQGMSQAIIIGDLLYTRAMELLVEVESLQARKHIVSMLEQVVIGQSIDLHYSYIPDHKSHEDIATKDHLKSGQYTFQGPMLFGAILGGADDQQLSQISVLGKQVGIAFQMRDDLLDRLPQDDGKTKFSDIQEGNQTVVRLALLDAVSPTEQEKLTTLRGTQITTQDQARLTELIETYDIELTVRKQIHDYLQKSRDLFASGSWSDEYEAFFVQIIDFLDAR